MITSSKFILMLLLISFSTHAIAQTDYYYYKGNKIPLTRNNNKVCVSIPKDCDIINERILTNVKELDMIKDKNFDIHVISQSDFEKLTSLDSWEEDLKSVILTSSYFTENNEEVYSTPYLNVQLKREQDIDLLNSYGEMYRLRIVRNSQLMPLWYILSVTPDSDKTPLECANEMFESGNFASSVPDLAAPVMLVDETAVQSSTKTMTENPSEIYDLQGRRLSETPAKGMYIRDGRKYVK